jgi:hypothetical protein
MKAKDILEILKPYCREIRKAGSGHYVAYPYNSPRPIAFSSTPSDRNWHKQLFREFRRCGVIIEELKNK